MNTLDDIVAKFKEVRSAVICSHVSPDSDAVASSCGLALGLQQLGVAVTVYLQDGVPEKLLPLLGGLTVTNEVPSHSVDAVISVDTATRRRVGDDVDSLFRLGKLSISIDHHLSNPGWADLNYIDATSASTAEIIFEVLGRLGVAIGPEHASLLLAGVMDDTGSFRFSNTTERTLHAAGKLIQLGASPSSVAEHLYYSVPLRALRLKARVLDGLQIGLEGRFGYVTVTNALLEEFGCSSQDTDGIIEEVRSISNLACAALIRELDGRWKVSLRSKLPSLDVNAVAGRFGGGGHPAAAGFSFAGELTSLLPEMESELRRMLDI